MRMIGVILAEGTRRSRHVGTHGHAFENTEKHEMCHLLLSCICDGWW